MRFTKRFKENLMLIVIGVVLFFALTNYHIALNILGYIYDVLYPVLLGCLFAFILNVPMSAIERHLFKTPKKEKSKKIVSAIKRPLSIVLTLLIAVGIVVLLGMLVIPSLGKTLSTLSDSAQTIVNNLSSKIERSKALKSIFTAFGIKKASFANGLADFLSNSVTALRSMNSAGSVASAIFSSIVNVVLALFFSIYFLAMKETLKRQMKKFSTAFLPPKADSKLTAIVQRSVDTFGKFLTGQCTDAVLLGTLCALGMWLFGFPYPLLMGVVIAVAALIPVLGSCIGMLIGFMLISTTSITQALWFVVYLLILIQIDCNFIYPHIVGNSVGLPSLWVLFAVTVGGRMFGVIGMFLAVPVCAIVYSALSVIVNDRCSGKTPRRRLRFGMDRINDDREDLTEEEDVSDFRADTDEAATDMEADVPEETSEVSTTPQQ